MSERASIRLELFAAAFAVMLAGTAASAAEDLVLVTVDGTPIGRAQVAERAWKEYGSASLNALVDELLVRKAAEKLALKADAKEVDFRLKRIQGRFKDEAAFKEHLLGIGSNLEEFRAQLELQVLRDALVVKARGIKVSEADVKEYYEANREKLATPDAVHLRHSVVGSEKEANDFIAAVKAGADFAKLAAASSLDGATKEKGGDMGFVPKGVLPAEVELLVFSLNPGDLGGPLATDRGFSIFKAEEFRAGVPLVFKDIEKDLKLALLDQRIGKALPGYLAELRAKAKIVPGAAK